MSMPYAVASVFALEVTVAVPVHADLRRVALVMDASLAPLTYQSAAG